MEIWHFVYFNTGLVQNLGHLMVFLELWAHLFQENLGTRRLATKSEGTQLVGIVQVRFASILQVFVIIAFLECIFINGFSLLEFLYV